MLNITPSSRTPDTRGDEYGFLPWCKGQGPVPRACQKALSARQLPVAPNVEKLLSRDKKSQRQTHAFVDESKAASRLQKPPMSDIIRVLQQRATQRLRNTPAERLTHSVKRSIFQSSQPHPASYPLDYREFVSFLESSNQHCPANIPALVTMDYEPNDTLIRGGVIRVCRGMIVNAIYKCQDWLYVISPENRAGYVPFECVDPVGIVCSSGDGNQQFPDAAARLYETVSVECLDSSGTTGSPFPSPRGGIQLTGTNPKKMTQPPCGRESDASASVLSPRDLSDDSGIHEKPEDSVEGASTASEDLDRSQSGSPGLEDHHIYENISDLLDPRPQGCSTGTKLTVLFDFIPIHSQDLAVKSKEMVRLISKGEGEWIWVEKQGGARGFIPKNYAINLARFNLQPDAQTTYL